MPSTSDFGNLDKGSGAPISATRSDRVIRRMHVFDDVQPTVGQYREQNVERCPLVLGVMAAVIEYDVETAHLADNVRKKRRICL